MCSVCEKVASLPQSKALEIIAKAMQKTATPHLDKLLDRVLGTEDTSDPAAEQFAATEFERRRRPE